MLWWLGATAALLSLVAIAYLLLALWTMGHWHPLLPERDAGATEEVVCDWPGISVLKPLYGDEDYLYPALRSFCNQDYPIFEIIFGVQRPTDPAIAVVQR
ncbi:MAG: bacteriohopanetetrol glucosamine biosynthesis glycosyltransferase HpnI, partial [Acidithiobacillus sp.]